MFVIGAGQTWLFRRALMGDHFYIFLFAISLFPLMMVAFEDQYSVGRYYLEVLTFGFLYFRVLRAIPFRVRSGCGDLRSFGKQVGHQQAELPNP